MKNALAVTISCFIIFLHTTFKVPDKVEENYVPDPLLQNQTILLENKKSALETKILTNLELQSYALDTLGTIINKKRK